MTVFATSKGWNLAFKLTEISYGLSLLMQGFAKVEDDLSQITNTETVFTRLTD